MAHEPAQVHSLEDQIQHQAGFLRDFVLPHQLPMIVVGHSIGAYIAAHALQLLEHELQASRSPVVKVRWCADVCACAVCTAKSDADGFGDAMLLARHNSAALQNPLPCRRLHVVRGWVCA